MRLFIPIPFGASLSPSWPYAALEAVGVDLDTISSMEVLNKLFGTPSSLFGKQRDKLCLEVWIEPSIPCL